MNCRWSLVMEPTTSEMAWAWSWIRPLDVIGVQQLLAAGTGAEDLGWRPG